MILTILSEGSTYMVPATVALMSSAWAKVNGAQEVQEVLICAYRQGFCILQPMAAYYYSMCALDASSVLGYCEIYRSVI